MNYLFHILYSQINSLQITGTDVPASFAASVSAHPIRFAMDDGRITSVCPSSDDAVWVVNMKRSILSALQNAFEADQLRVDEVVTGDPGDDTQLFSRTTSLVRASRRMRAKRPVTTGRTHVRSMCIRVAATITFTDHCVLNRTK
jgi:hypothetical protein